MGSSVGACDTSYSPLSPSSTYTTAPQPDFPQDHVYTDIQKERLSMIIGGVHADPNRSFLIDLFDFMSSCIAQGHYLPDGEVQRLLDLSKSWRNSRTVHKLHLLLRQDLRLRPETLSPQVIDDINIHLNESMRLLRSDEQLLPIQLTLNYFLEVLKRCLHCDKITSSVDSSIKYEAFIDRTKKWSFFSKIIRMVFIVSEKLEDGRCPQLLLLQAFRQDLLALLCVPLCGKYPQDTVERVAFAFEEGLRGMISVSMRKEVLLLVPSDLLREKIIDIHLENEFQFNSLSEAWLRQLQEAPFNLMKLCFIHVRRVLYTPSGEPHDLSYFLFLIVNLLQSHIIKITGTQPSSLFSPLLKVQNVSGDLCAQLEDIKPHIASLIDRLSEDEVLLKQLFTEDCLSEIQSLSEVVNVTIKSLEPSFQ